MLNKINTMAYLKNIFSIDLRALALLRIGLGAYLVIFLFNIYPDIPLLFASTGIGKALSIITFDFDFLIKILQILNIAENKITIVKILFLINAVSALFLIIGYKTKFNLILSWFLLSAIQYKLVYMMTGFDFYLKLLLLWLIFLPVNYKYALDGNNTKENNYYSLATVGLISQIGLFYFFSAILKSPTEWLETPYTLYYILYNNFIITDFGYFIRDFIANTYFLNFIAKLVLLIEFLTPFILLITYKKNQVRLIWFVILFLMHFAFYSFIKIGVSVIVCMFALLILLPKYYWDLFEQYLIKLTSKFQYFSSINNYLKKNKQTFTIIPANSRRKNILISLLITNVFLVNIESYNGMFRTGLYYYTSFAMNIFQSWRFFDILPNKSNIVRIYGVSSDNSKIPLFLSKSDHPDTKSNNIKILDYSHNIKNVWWREYLLLHAYKSNELKKETQDFWTTTFCAYQHNPKIKQITIEYENFKLDIDIKNHRANHIATGKEIITKSCS